MSSRSRRLTAAASGAALAALIPAATATAGPSSPTVVNTRTSQSPELLATAPGVAIRPILSAGDVVPSAGRNYQMSGTPDGIGAYRSSASRLQVLFNHEFDGTAPAGVGARVSKVTLDNALNVKAGRYLLTGREGFLRFCSATLTTIGGVPYYTTGEESTDTNKTAPTGHGGSSIVINAETGAWRETRQFGLFAHENVVPVKGLSKAMVVSGEDGTADQSQFYAYTAATFNAAFQGSGVLRVFVPDVRVKDGNPSNNDISKGQTLKGHFEAVPKGANANADTLEAAAQAKGAFDFTRVEDIAVSKTEPGVMYFNDTGSLGAETERGRTFRLRVNPKNPAEASLTLLLDGDHGDNLVNPDNLDTSAHSLVIQEDRNTENRGANVRGGYSRVLRYDFATKRITPVARVKTVGGEPGEWESSGVIDASKLLGKDMWLLDVQAHTLVVPQPGLDLRVGSSSGEGGQLLAIRIPNSS